MINEEIDWVMLTKKEYLGVITLNYIEKSGRIKCFLAFFDKKNYNAYYILL